jgi:hypothetical protein
MQVDVGPARPDGTRKSGKVPSQSCASIYVSCGKGVPGLWKRSEKLVIADDFEGLGTAPTLRTVLVLSDASFPVVSISSTDIRTNEPCDLLFWLKLKREPIHGSKV